MADPATVVFDLDGTLADTAPDLMAATNRALAGTGIAPLDLATTRRLIGTGARALLLGAARSSGRELTDTDLDILTGRFRADIAACPVRDTTLYPGATATLETLKRGGARLAVCTNKHASLVRPVLAALGIEPWFDAVVGAGDAPALKPDPRPLLLSIATAGGSPARALMVGDSRTDVTAARRAGIPVIVADWGYGTETAPALGADAVFGDFGQVPGLASRLIPA